MKFYFSLKSSGSELGWKTNKEGTIPDCRPLYSPTQPQVVMSSGEGLEQYVNQNTNLTKRKRAL